MCCKHWVKPENLTFWGMKCFLYHYFYTKCQFNSSLSHKEVNKYTPDHVIAAVNLSIKGTVHSKMNTVIIYSFHSKSLFTPRTITIYASTTADNIVLLLLSAALNAQAL